MASTEVNGIVVPDYGGKPVVHEDLLKIARQHVLREVMIFANAAERSAIFGTLGVAPLTGSISYLQDVGAHFRYNGSTWVLLQAAPNHGAVSNVGVPGTTSSATYVDMPAGTSFSFTKADASTAIAVAMNIVWFTTVGVTAGMFGVRINGVDYDVGKLMINEANTYRQFAGLARVPAGAVPAGTYTVQARWRQHTGTGVLTVSTDSWFAISATEVR